MAHYALLDSDNMVIQVFVGRHEDDLADGVTDWEEYYAPAGKTVRRTSFNTRAGVHVLGGEPFRGNYAGIGFTFDPDKGTDGAFIPAKPFESWVLNEDTYQWEAPIPYPAEGMHTWDEQAGVWVEVEDEAV